MLLGGCSDTPAPAPDTSAADQKAIRDGEAAWPGYWTAKDLDKIVSLYADDASVMIPDMPLLKGKDAIRSGFGTFVADKNLVFRSSTTSVNIAKGGDLAYSQGTYDITMTNPKTKKAEEEKGKYVTVYKKQADGSWKAVADINNADAPATPVRTAKAEKAGKKAAPVTKKKRKR
jgi:uncharacterized protein (TIGR02246 family)